MKKFDYESPEFEVLEMQADAAILQDSASNLENYNPVGWEW